MVLNKGTFSRYSVDMSLSYGSFANKRLYVSLELSGVGVDDKCRLVDPPESMS